MCSITFNLFAIWVIYLDLYFIIFQIQTSLYMHISVKITLLLIYPFLSCDTSLKKDFPITLCISSKYNGLVLPLFYTNSHFIDINIICITIPNSRFINPSICLYSFYYYYVAIWYKIYIFSSYPIIKYIIYICSLYSTIRYRIYIYRFKLAICNKFISSNVYSYY